ncbi:MAG: YdiU family protein [Thalassovita sp.]
MKTKIPFDNSYGTLPERFFTRQAPTPVSAPALIVFNEALAQTLGIDVGDAQELAEIFGGNHVPHGADPLAQVYAGHQFGGFSPQLGDGRALLLGELRDASGEPRDLQLKGSGPTPYSRRGDGRAWLGPVLREYVLSEAMHALGVPTTRALAAVLSGDRVQRERGYPGAVLTRVAASHIRVGTFQYFYARQDLEGLSALFAYTKARHYPEVTSPQELLDAVIARQVKLVVKWLSLGFIHGVMNTDNTSLSGETIDYGPAAYLDTYHPQTVYSSIDHGGRYAYDNQANILAWNMAQLASSLVPLVENTDEAISEFTKSVNGMRDLIEAEWVSVFGQKIGIADATQADKPLITELLQLMAENKTDFTNTFFALRNEPARDQFLNPEQFDQWALKWQARLVSETDPDGVMARANPVLIPRNHRIEQMISAAVDGDFAPFHRLNAALARPFEVDPAFEELRRPPEPTEEVRETFCGT